MGLELASLVIWPSVFVEGACVTAWIVYCWLAPLIAPKREFPSQLCLCLCSLALKKNGSKFPWEFLGRVDGVRVCDTVYKCSTQLPFFNLSIWRPDLNVFSFFSTFINHKEAKGFFLLRDQIAFWDMLCVLKSTIMAVSNFNTMIETWDWKLSNERRPKPLCFSKQLSHAQLIDNFLIFINLAISFGFIFLLSNFQVYVMTWFHRKT